MTTPDFEGDTEAITHHDTEDERRARIAEHRDRIGRVMQRSRDRYPEVRESLAAELDAGEFVYREALRDVLGLMSEHEVRVGEYGLTFNIVSDSAVIDFATERGIELENDHD